jgi:hypothetical protein
MDGLYFAVGWAEHNGRRYLFPAAYAGARYASKRGIPRLIHAYRLWMLLRQAGVVPGKSTLSDRDMDKRLAALRGEGEK